MSDDLLNAMLISSKGMQAQGTRIRVISENIANQDTAANVPGEEPYARQVITFKNALDRELGIKTVKVDDIKEDPDKDFPSVYMPDHPGADEKGYVLMPNVNTLIEMMDVREAQRSYEANLGLIQQTRGMVQRTVDLLR